MNKRIILVILLAALLLQDVCDAQHIYFSDTTNLWIRKSEVLGGASSLSVGYHPYRIGDSSVLWQGRSYSVLVPPPEYNEPPLLVRDDTAGKRVYVKLSGQSFSHSACRVTNTQQEFVYMDYSLGVGDTLWVPIVREWSSDSLSALVVRAVDSILVNAAWYRRIIMDRYQSDGPTYGFGYIEGFGPMDGPLMMGGGPFCHVRMAGVLPQPGKYAV